jgi:hypothetical protein
MAGGLVFNSIATEVWKDPYLTNVKRDETDRSSTGIRYTWDKIFQSNFEVQATIRKIDIDKEKSGSYPALGLSRAEQGLLDREGDLVKLEGSYTFRIKEGQALVPKLIYTKNDLDGGAMRSDDIALQLSYLHTVDRFNFIFNGFLGFADYDNRNPIFNKTREDDNFGLAVSAFYLMPDYKPMGCTSFRFWGNAAYYKSSANINFYDTEVAALMAGVILYY